ncbi:hypothetical protein [Methylococcus sp. EFPC2]|uniref:hypothetical protein n=1 Tax=Methylococcus sp. EFPC2 TaxID=2812648 RepID=UPI0019687E24|nr:hypothetical protein [Methylococcus sp. EFPC2]QSA96603.1 hypothetical protein JWZ97_15485 [Methylococcus sp. EFPC2]
MNDQTQTPSTTPTGAASALTVELGATRAVLLVGRMAIKVPRLSTWRTFLNGLLANMQEREFWRTRWAELCPVLFSLPGGWLVVMPRAKPLTDADWCAFDTEEFIERSDGVIPVEEKQDSFGWLNGRIVAIDYGT